MNHPPSMHHTHTAAAALQLAMPHIKPPRDIHQVTVTHDDDQAQSS